MIRQILKENWQMRRAGDKAARPAVVPGTVYTDLLRNGEMEDPFWKPAGRAVLCTRCQKYTA